MTSKRRRNVRSKTGAEKQEQEQEQGQEKKQGPEQEQGQVKGSDGRRYATPADGGLASTRKEGRGGVTRLMEEAG